MNWLYLLAFSVLVTISSIGRAQTQFSNYFSGFYGGFEGGIVSYNTQITFDGVNDPAGRGGALFGALFGYNQAYDKIFVAVEMFYNFKSDIDPYTFDSKIVGFGELDLQQSNSFGLDFRAGYLITETILLYGIIGYSTSKQSVLIDSKPLDQFEGGAAAKRYSTFQLGAGLEVAIHSRLVIRVSFKTLDGQDLDTSDFGTILTNTTLTHFEIKPNQQQFLISLIYHFPK